MGAAQAPENEERGVRVAGAAVVGETAKEKSIAVRDIAAAPALCLKAGKTAVTVVGG